MKKLFFFLFVGAIQTVQGQSKPEDTEVWEPVPKVIVPGQYSDPPSDAVVLFAGNDLTKWKHEGSSRPVEWTLNEDNSLTVKPGTGNIETMEEHGSIQLHLEWKSPEVVKGEGQYRGNSGVFFQRRYEVQILDSYHNKTYANGQASSIYKQHIPLVNAMRPTGEWQVYDIVFNEPQFDAQGEKIKSGRFTVFLNGVLVQNNVEILGTTEYIGPPKNKRDDMPGDNTSNQSRRRSLVLQDHGDLVSFRNIWWRKL